MGSKVLLVPPLVRKALLNKNKQWHNKYKETKPHTQTNKPNTNLLGVLRLLPQNEI
jgi:hypothetical protein